MRLKQVYKKRNKWEVILLLPKNFTEEEMKTKAREMAEFVYRTTRENEASEFDKFMYQLISEYLEMKNK